MHLSSGQPISVAACRDVNGAARPTAALHRLANFPPRGMRLRFASAVWPERFRAVVALALGAAGRSRPVKQSCSRNRVA